MKNLNSTILIIFLSLLISCKKSKGELHYINLYSTTITLLKCENLKKSSQLKNIILSEKENSEMLTIFSHLKPVKDNFDVDSRLYGTVYESSKRFDFCMSTTIIEINNKKFFVDDELRDYIVKLTN